MDRDTALKLVRGHINTLDDTADLIAWNWLIFTMEQISKEEWEHYLEKALGVLSK